MKSLAGWKTADLYVSVLIHETFISLIRHPAMMFFVGFFFCRKNPNSKASFPPRASRRPAVVRTTWFSAPELLTTHPVYVYTIVFFHRTKLQL